MNQPNKFDLLNRVTVSTLDAKAKILLVELILRWNQETGQLNPGVERLCKIRGIKNAKNFKGADFYLPGIVNVQRSSGKRNTYSLNLQAIMSLPEADVNTEKYTTQNPPATEGYPALTDTTNSNPPSVEGYYPPSVEGYYPPSVEGYYPPSVEGSDSSVNSSLDTSYYREDVPQTEELPGGDSLVNSIGAPRLVSKIDSSFSGELRDAPSALGMEDLTNSAFPGLPKVAPTAPGQSESVTNSSSSGYPGESLAANAALASSNEEETVHVYNETVTSSLAIGNVPAPRTYAESVRLLKQEQDRKLMERIAAKKAEEAALQARQQEFRDAMEEPAPMPLESPQKAPRAFVAAPLDLGEVELMESPQKAAQSLPGVSQSVSRLDRYSYPVLAG